MRHDPRTMNFRHLATSWGLAVDLTAALIEAETPPATAIPVGGDVWVDESAVTLPSEDEHAVIRALIEASPRLGGALARPATFIVLDVDYTPTDYQPEALYCATLAWLSEEITRDLPMPDISFDPEANRYVVRSTA